MKPNLKRPCNDCPFRRKSTPGWLGSARPRQFLRTTLTESHMPCHKTVDYSNPTWHEDIETDDNVAFCAGALMFLNNNFKLPRDPELNAAVRTVPDETPSVFRKPEEFLAHHHDGTPFQRDLIGIGKRDPSYVSDMFIGIPMIEGEEPIDPFQILSVSVEEVEPGS